MIIFLLHTFFPLNKNVSRTFILLVFRLDVFFCVYYIAAFGTLGMKQPNKKKGTKNIKYKIYLPTYMQYIKYKTTFIMKKWTFIIECKEETKLMENFNFPFSVFRPRSRTLCLSMYTFSFLCLFSFRKQINFF